MAGACCSVGVAVATPVHAGVSVASPVASVVVAVVSGRSEGCSVPVVPVVAGAHHRAPRSPRYKTEYITYPLTIKNHRRKHHPI